MNDESMTVLRLAAEEPRISIWATIDLPPVRHRFSCFALSISRAGGGAMPTGKVTLMMDFKFDGGGMGKGGTITLSASRKIGEGRVEKTTPFKYALAEGQDIGEDTGSPIEFSYTPPFKFTGKLGRVTVELK